MTSTEQKLDDICCALDTENGHFGLNPDDDNVADNVRRAVFEGWCKHSVAVVMGTERDPEAAPFEREAAEDVARLRALVTSRWARLRRVSNSGKTLFLCRCCERVSATPDKSCPDSGLEAECSTWRDA